MKIFFQFKKKRKGKEGGEWRNESRGKKQGSESLFCFIFSLFLLFISFSPYPRNELRVFKSGNVRLSRCTTFEIEHNGATDALSLLLSSFGRHRYKTAFASLSNPRSYSLSLSLSFPSYTLCHLSSPFVSARHAYVYTRPVVHRYPVYGSRISARGLTTTTPLRPFRRIIIILRILSAP